MMFQMPHMSDPAIAAVAAALGQAFHFGTRVLDLIVHWRDSREYGGPAIRPARRRQTIPARSHAPALMWDRPSPGARRPGGRKGRRVRSGRRPGRGRLALQARAS